MSEIHEQSKSECEEKQRDEERQIEKRRMDRIKEIFGIDTIVKEDSERIKTDSIDKDGSIDPRNYSLLELISSTIKEFEEVDVTQDLEDSSEEE